MPGASLFGILICSFFSFLAFVNNLMNARNEKKEHKIPNNEAPGIKEYVKLSEYGF